MLIRKHKVPGGSFLALFYNRKYILKKENDSIVELYSQYPNYHYSLRRCEASGALSPPQSLRHYCHFVQVELEVGLPYKKAHALRALCWWHWSCT